MPLDLYRYPKLSIHKLMSFPNLELQISAQDGPQVMFCKCKPTAWRTLQEDIKVYTDKNMNEGVLNIKAREVLDFYGAGTFDVTDAGTGAKVGTLRRHGWKSNFISDEWTIMTENDRAIVEMKESNIVLSLLRNSSSLKSYPRDTRC